MQKIWRSIFWKIASCGCFAGINVLVRYLSGGSPIALNNPLPVYSIMFFQNVIGMILISIWMLSTNKGNLPVRTTRPWLHCLRIMIAIFGIAIWYMSLRYIPVTQVVAISFVAPIITTIGAVLLLKENLDLQRKIAITLSIVAGFLIARPDKTLNMITDYSWYLLLPLLAAFVFSLDKVLTRQLLAFNESPQTLAWYLLCFTGPICLIPCLHYGWVTPDIAQLPSLLLLGGLGALAHYSFNKAYALSEVTFLLPFGAAKIILCAIISYVVFYEAPRTTDMWLGIIVITLSTIILSIPLKIFQYRLKYQ